MYKESQSTVADPGFPRRGGGTLRGGRQHTIFSNFPQNCIKLKEFGPPVGMRDACPIDPPPIKTFLHRIIPQTIPLGRPILCKSKMEQECIPVGCVLPVRYCMGCLPNRDPPDRDPQRSPRKRTPLDRDPLDKDLHKEILLDRDPPGQRPPLDRDPPWTETPLSKDKQL